MNSSPVLEGVLADIGESGNWFFARTFAHVRAAADLAGVLGTAGVDPATDVEETGWCPMSGVGDDFVEEREEAFGLVGRVVE